MRPLVLGITFFFWVIAEGRFVPGKNCGISSPIHFLDDLKPGDSCEDLECVSINDQKSFKELCVDTKPGTTSH